MHSYTTQYFLSKTKLLKTQDEITSSNHIYSMFNTGGVEVEVGDLLYGLVKCWKPELIVETGTHLGVSAAYMGQALKENGKGLVATYEVISSLQKTAIALWNDVEVNKYVKPILKSSLNADVDLEIDILFLDSEPQYRFDEFLKFWPKVKEGGLIIVHDLHPSLGHHGQTYHGVYDWPYGDWKLKLGEYIKKHLVQTIHVPNPRGTVVFQKTRNTDQNIEMLNQEFNQN